MTLLRRILAVVAVLGFLCPLPAQAALPPQETIKEFYAQLVATMKEGKELGFKGRFEKLAPAVQAAYNMPIMTRLAVGSSWAAASPKEQADLITAFTNFSVANYASRFASYDGEVFTVIKNTPSPNNVIVETELKPATGDVVTLNYLMKPDEKGKFRIIDVFMNGTISELATRRSEFSSIARREGIQSLINSLEGKAKQMANP